MGFVASILLMNMEDEEDVFWTLTALLDSDLHMRDYYTTSLKQIQVHWNDLSFIF